MYKFTYNVNDTYVDINLVNKSTVFDVHAYGSNTNAYIYIVFLEYFGQMAKVTEVTSEAQTAQKASACIKHIKCWYRIKWFANYLLYTSSKSPARLQLLEFIGFPSHRSPWLSSVKLNLCATQIKRPYLLLPHRVKLFNFTYLILKVHKMKPIQVD